MNFIAKAVAKKGVDVLKKKTGDALDVAEEFEANRVDRKKTMKEALIAKFRFLKNDLIAPEKSKFKVSSKLEIDDFLRRMIIENPEAIVCSYADHLLHLDASATSTELLQFSGEISVVQHNVVRILGVMRKNSKDFHMLQDLSDFLDDLDTIKSLADHLAALSDKDRKKVLSGDKKDLTSEQKSVLLEMEEVGILREEDYGDAKENQKEMEWDDIKITDLLKKLHEEDLLAEKKGKVDKKGKGKKSKKEAEIIPEVAQEAVGIFEKSQPKKSSGSARGWGSVKQVGDESIEEMDEAV